MPQTNYLGNQWHAWGNGEIKSKCTADNVRSILGNFTETNINVCRAKLHALQEKNKTKNLNSILILIPPTAMQVFCTVSANTVVRLESCFLTFFNLKVKTKSIVLANLLFTLSASCRCSLRPCFWLFLIAPKQQSPFLHLHLANLSKTWDC